MKMADNEAANEGFRPPKAHNTTTELTNLNFRPNPILEKKTSESKTSENKASVEKSFFEQILLSSSH